MKWTTYTVTTNRLPERRQPSNETGIYLFLHKHDWVERGTHTWPSGTVDPVFVCRRCGDVICTNSVVRKSNDSGSGDPS